MGKVMQDVGYSEAYAKNPAQLTRTKSMRELLEQRLGLDKLIRLHEELLASSSIENYLFPKQKNRKGPTDVEIKFVVESVPGCRLIYIKRDFMGAWAYFQAPDNLTRYKALDIAYKLHGSYAPDKIEIVKRKYQHLTNAELAAHIKKLKDFLLKR